ncbi:hypothetical protein ACMHYJ_02165 [Castellaniella hirudinis]|uniref:hypothetical protein n=1 Tax=Castellaniella hirudinis TaxID=1144617 RepID=UPI0039C16C3E
MSLKTISAPQAPGSEDAHQIDAVQHAEVERMAVILRQFGDGVPFEPYRYEMIIRDHLSRSAEAMLAAGRALIVARESLAHGDWMPFIERIGLEESLARRMMQAAYKFCDDKTVKLVQAAGNKSKLFELLVLDDDEIQELTDGGTVAGLEIDDIKRKGVRELRAALRDALEEKKASEKLLADKNEKIDALQTNLEKTKNRIAAGTVEEQTIEATNDVAGICLRLMADIMTPMRESISRLLELQPGAGAVVTGHIAQIQQALDEVSTEFLLGQVVANTPDWAQE